MPTFCRHNRFIERCPICSRTLPGNEPEAPRRARGATGSRRGSEHAGGRPRRDGLRVRREGRAAEDGYSSPLAPGLRASADAARLADEIAFSAERLAALTLDAPGAYEAALEAAAGGELERAGWIAFLLAYLSPAEDDEPFAGIEAVLAAAPGPASVPDGLGELVETVRRGPRTSHQPGSGARTLLAYGQWLQRSGGSQAAFTGDPGWAPERRFARLFERLGLPGLSRAGRYELLVTLGRLGVFELRADSLHLSSPRSTGAEDPATLAAKRVFGIGDPLLLDRRAGALADAAGAPLEALDLALFNWSASERATLGFRPAGEPDAGPAAAALGV
jgi:hypothetical protein